MYDDTIASDFIADIKNVFTVDINFWKTPLRITFKNLRSFEANICGGVPYYLKFSLCGSQ